MVDGAGTLSSFCFVSVEFKGRVNLKNAIRFQAIYMFYKRIVCRKIYHPVEIQEKTNAHCFATGGSDRSTDWHVHSLSYNWSCLRGDSVPR